MNESETTLYRMYDCCGLLLYIGISFDINKRFKSHTADKNWFRDVSVVRLERHATRFDALNAERLSISIEKPLYNVMHNTSGNTVRPPKRRKKKINFRSVGLRMDRRVEDVLFNIHTSNLNDHHVINDILFMFFKNRNLYEKTISDNIWSEGKELATVHIPSDREIEGKIDHIGLDYTNVEVIIETLFLMYKMNGYKIPDSEIIQPNRI